MYEAPPSAGNNSRTEHPDDAISSSLRIQSCSGTADLSHTECGSAVEAVSLLQTMQSSITAYPHLPQACASAGLPATQMQNFQSSWRNLSCRHSDRSKQQ